MKIKKNLPVAAQSMLNINHDLVTMDYTLLVVLITKCCFLKEELASELDPPLAISAGL